MPDNIHTTAYQSSKTRTFSQGESYGDAMEFVQKQLIVKVVGEGPDLDCVLVRKYRITVCELSNEPEPEEDI